MGLLTQLIYFVDNFTAPAILRVKGNPERASICTGVFSMFLIGFFTYIFVIKSLQIMNFQQVQANILVDDQVQHIKTGQVMFAMNIFQEHAMIVDNPYFQFQAYIFDENENIIEQINLQLCKLSQWEGVDLKILTDYYDIQNWFCPQKPVPLSGVRGEQDMRFINLKIDFCLSFGYCQSRADIQAYIQSQKVFYGYITGQFIVKDVGFTLKSQQSTMNSIKYFKATFTQTAGIALDIWVAEYEIETDTNMLPWESYSKQKGVYVLNQEHFTTQYDADYNYLVEANIRFDSKTQKISRSYGKIDDVLSYAGGLMGIVVGFFAFFLGSYNQYRYELSVAKDCFQTDKQSEQKTSKQMNFFVYIGYVFFDWFNTVTCCEPKWNRMQKINIAREQAAQQMNVNFLYKKIQHLENICSYQLPNDEILCLGVLANPHIDEVRKKRQSLQYYSKITQNQSTTLLKDIYPQGLDCPQLQREQKLRDLRPQQMKDVLQNYKLSYPEEFEIVEDLELEEDDQQIQSQIAQAFFKLSQDKRGSIQGKYPVTILYCLLRRKKLIKYSRKHIELQEINEKNSANGFLNNNKVSPLDASQSILQKSS